MRLIYHPDAEAELLEAVLFYEGRVPGLGERFLNDFQEAISKIQEAPGIWQRLENDLHRYLMPRFPYGIYYRVEGGDLRILVVKHHSRHPGDWHYRKEAKDAQGNDV